MKTQLQELMESWKQPWPREEVLRPELVEESTNISTPEPAGTNVSTNEAKIDIVETSIPVPRRGRGGVKGKRRETDKIGRRREVIKLMRRKTPELTSKQIAKILNEPRGTIWHDILYLRKVLPEFANWGVKGKGKWVNSLTEAD